MSRSRRKTPITGWTTVSSEKSWKQAQNRRRRLAEKMAVRNGEDVMPDPTRGQFGPKDGKAWWGSDGCRRK